MKSSLYSQERVPFGLRMARVTFASFPHAVIDRLSRLGRLT